ncbi:MAG: hypothetical protein D6681_15170 [Calditrichaeota bacterium]|nr:MAG: hypothetical protein D6681_15170 [Calditrichota bacterium]
MDKKPILIFVNPKSSQIKEYTLSFRRIGLALLIVLAAVVFSFKYSVHLIGKLSQNSRISQLEKENAILRAELKKISDRIAELRSNLDLIEEKDDRLRAMLDLPPINEDVRQVGIGGGESFLANSELGSVSFGSELIETLNLLEKLDREIRLEKVSYQKLLTTVERRQDSLQYLPALIPVQNAYLSSGFGNRIHPIRKRRQFHKGVDLATNRGTPVIAPADGYVTFAGTNGGFGKFVQINHKYGFETLYGHLDKIYVRKGQFVKRGDKIGEVGSTGLATSTHLHYEVHYNGKPLNPVNFFLNDMTY